jgi:hypothetical protein
MLRGEMMNQYDAPFEIHVHGDVSMRAGTTYDQVQEALKPLWSYTGARTLAKAAASAYAEEPGIRFDATKQQLQMCWTTSGDLDIRQPLEEMCLSLNELAADGAAIEVSIHDMAFDDDQADSSEQARDDFMMMFVGPTLEAILQVQRDMLVEDVTRIMVRHFDGNELGGIASEIDRLFAARLQAMADSLHMGGKGLLGSAVSGHNSLRRPRHLH